MIDLEHDDSLAIQIEAYQGNYEPLVEKVLNFDVALSVRDRAVIAKILLGGIKKKSGRKVPFRTDGEFQREVQHR